MLLLKEQQGGLGEGRSRVWFFAANRAFVKSVPLAWGHFLAHLFSLLLYLPVLNFPGDETHVFPYSRDLGGS